MKVSETPFSADWLAISVRWIVVVGLAWAVARGRVPEVGSAWPLVLIIAWNLAMTVLASENMRLPYHRYINLVLDVILSGTLFAMQGGLRGPASWSGLLPILTAALYFELRGALPVAGLSAILAVSSGWSYVRSHWPLGLAWIIGTVGIGALSGLLGVRVVRRLRSKRQAWFEAEETRHRVERERLRAIYELSSTLTATLSYRRVLDSALDLSYSALNPDSTETAVDPLVSAVLLFEAGKMRIVCARRLTSADERIILDGSEGVLKKVFEEGEPVFAQDVGNDPELGRVIALRSCKSAYCLPMRTGFNVYGTMLFAHPDRGFFTPVRRNLLNIVGGQAAIAVYNARLYQDLVEEKERMVEVNEEARRKLARDLHDGPTQSVAAMAMRISIVRRMLDTDPSGASEELTRIEDLAQRAGKEIRHTLFTLRPLVLETQGLVAAVRALAEKMRETFDQNVVVEADDQVAVELEATKQGILFYVIEEAINNARKHANAGNIWVRLRPFQTGVALVEVEDDGSGFDVGLISRAYDRRSSLGLINMRERVELLNGVLEVHSATGKGTKVSVYVPLSKEAADRLQHAKASWRTEPAKQASP